jgi:quinoprotein glucose dehydrogenase
VRDVASVLLSPAGRPCVAPPWGELVAIEPDRNDRVAGDPGRHAGCALGQSPQPTSAPNLGGPVTSETGLVFIGATMDGFFRAFDTRDGREVWSARLPTSARATPLIYSTEGNSDGRDCGRRP